MGKKLVLALVLLFAVVVVASFFADHAQLEKKIPEQVYKPTYEVKLMGYMMTVSKIPKDISYCFYKGEAANYALVAEKFQTTIKRGNLTEVKQSIKELSAAAYSIPVHNKKIHSDISEAESDLFQKVGELESKNETTHPVPYYYELINDSSYCGARPTTSYSGATGTSVSSDDGRRY